MGDDFDAATVTLVQCTDSKYGGERRAGDKYQASRYFRRMREWALDRGDPWFILSAKYGLLHPDETINNYDERGLSEPQAVEISEQLADKGFHVVHITGGKDYTDPLVPELELRGMDVVEHFRGMQIGEREAALQAAVE
jgi:hypothetical protein